jgi:hypothetical protein
LATLTRATSSDPNPGQTRISAVCFCGIFIVNKITEIKVVFEELRRSYLFEDSKNNYAFNKEFFLN